MKFHFPFEKLLEIRRRLEDVARRDHAVAARAVADANAELREMYNAIDLSRVRAQNLERAGDAPSAPIAMIDEFIRGQGVRIDRARARLRELLAEAEKMQELLVESARDRKTLEKLRERRMSEHKVAATKLELRRADDLATMRFAREQRNGSTE